ncbi:hypothetical protein ACFWUQ_14555 [Streptomyces sp. NPDC058662]|uniref:hypothetical protein n=1 Tax=Streptomyces sp. NPDC058662 TaxID=3346583 RepID=UPI00365DA7BA
MILDDIDARLRRAVLNNADWCHAVCAAHGLPGDVRDGGAVWASAARTPPLYPDAITLDASATAEDVLPAIDTDGSGCSVKDSFARLDLEDAGFEVIVEAQWIHRPAGTPVATAGDGGDGAASGGGRADALLWSRVSSPQELVDWEAAWGGGESTGLFRPELLLRKDIAFLAGRSGGRIVAGAVGGRGSGVVGVSNVFTADEDRADAVWAAVLAEVTALWPGADVVGYESGEDLDAALRHGFAPLGPLRVWLSRTG